MTDIPSAAELAEVRLFVRRFIPTHRQARWQTVLEGKPSKWDRLDMDDLFRVAVDSGPIRRTELEEELQAPDLAKNPRATLFRFSGEPYFLRGCVYELVDQVVEDDALIVAHHGEVELASHHSSSWIVCRSKKEG